MNTARSMSYAPQSTAPRGRTDEPIEASHPQWTLCRKLQSVPIQDNATLQRWTERGRVEPDDYLLCHQLDLCVQAREIAELDAVFRRMRARLLEKASRILAGAALAVVWIVPMLGGLLFAGAVGAAVLSTSTACCAQTYRLHNSLSPSGSR